VVQREFSSQGGKMIYRTDSQIEAQRAIQCFLAHIGNPGVVYDREDYLPTGEGTSDGQGGLLRTAIFMSRDGPSTRVLLHKKEWDPKQQLGRRWWRAVRLQFWPNDHYGHLWKEFEPKPIEFGNETLFGGWELRFKYEFVPVENTRPIQLVSA